MWPWARGSPRNLGLPLSISTTAEASDFTFGTQLGFTKTHHKITPRGKRGGGLELKELPKFWVLYNISATTGSSDLKFGAPLGFAKGHKIKRRR